ncbi:MAG: glycosyltransferase family 2 protein [Acidimicrobiaceae bacterium]|nr:glycosyltransferase family 2 protein [Acidimicrobiaceae bacterium]MYE76237.1 glycosyltransferase family 2 protein [Acidimicrobiaceae bacterium]
MLRPVSAPDGCLSVVMPCYNEVATIDEIVSRVLASSYTGELIVVDDGSTDGTRRRLSQYDDPRVRVLLQPENRGKGAAVSRGFAETSCEFVVIQDADLEYDPCDWDQLLAPLARGDADVVYGVRTQEGTSYRVPYYWHMICNRMLTRLSNVFTGVWLSDVATCYKALRLEVVRSLDLRENRFGIDTEITAKVAAGGWRIWETGISYTSRNYAEGKKITWKDGIAVFVCIVRYGISVRLRPLIQSARTSRTS